MPQTQPLDTSPVDLLAQLKQNHAPITLTVNGTPEAVIQDVAGYQRLLDLAAQADEGEAIRQSEADGSTRPAEEFFAEFQSRHGLPD